MVGSLPWLIVLSFILCLCCRVVFMLVLLVCFACSGVCVWFFVLLLYVLLFVRCRLLVLFISVVW